MRNIKRIDKTLASIKEIWMKYPDMRLGQLLCNVLRDPALYYVEDDQLVKSLQEYYKGE